MERKVFSVCVSNYSEKHDFNVIQPASLDIPKDNAVMFMMGKYKDKICNLYSVSNCLIFWQSGVEVPKDLLRKHVFVPSDKPRLEYCRFFRDNNIRNLPTSESYKIINGAIICDGANVPSDSVVMPGAYLGGQVAIGHNTYVGVGVRIVGKVNIGDNVIIRENTVIGADGLTTDRDIDGTAITMPQFGGVIIDNKVEIGANCVIARGAIDDTVIETGCKIDNCTFISHNVSLGRDTFVVGETIMCGGSKTGARAYISGNATIRNKISIGRDAIVGMGAVVTKNVPDKVVVIGNPAESSN